MSSVLFHKKEKPMGGAIQQNEHDKLAVKLEGLREQHKKREREQKLQDELQRHEALLCQAFLLQTKREFGIGKEAVNELSDKDIDEIDRYLVERSKKSRGRQLILCACVPILGWMSFPFFSRFHFFSSDFSQLNNYALIREFVTKLRNDECFPHQRLREMAK